jgi:hypothetical protein
MISQLLRLYMRVNEIGMRELGPEIGISAATVSRISRGESVDGLTMLKLINWLFKDRSTQRGKKAVTQKDKAE